MYIQLCVSLEICKYIMYRNEWRYDCVNGLGNHLETVLVILMEEMGTHEGEDWHDVVKYTILSIMCQKKISIT